MIPIPKNAATAELPGSGKDNRKIAMITSEETSALDPKGSESAIIFPEYCWMDTAFGDVSHRNHVQRFEAVTLPDPPMESYTGMFQFKEDYCLLADRTGSVKGADDLACYCHWLWFDIDDPNLEAARGKTLELLTQLEVRYEVRSEWLTLYFSGSKGFHLGIPSGLFGAEPATDLPQIFKKMALALAEDIPIDTAIYDRNRLWRLPNSINAKSGLYKIPLTCDELVSCTAEDIRALANSPRESSPTVIPDDLPVPALAALYDTITKELRQQKLAVVPTPAVSVNKPCIEKLLAGVAEGDRNEAAIRLADFFMKQGLGQEAANEKLLEWNSRNRPPLPEAEIHGTIQSAYAGNYNYGCNDPLLNNLCDPKCPFKRRKKDDKPILTSFVGFADRTLLEMVYDKKAGGQTQFAKYHQGKVEYVDEFRDTTTGIEYRPIQAGKIIRSDTIHFPSRMEEYGSEKGLLELIDNFISKYLVVSPFFHTLSKYYVLLTWIYDNFTVLPYLRVKGDYGTGKSRFLQTVGSLCYKPIFCMGAATVSPIFRLIDLYRGTVIIDESDFNDSDDSHRIVKILNSGFQRGFPVLLTETVSNNKLEPQSFDVFGPKLIATRHEFKDRALESRCITEIMDKGIPPHIPINLPPAFWDEAREIRNRLLSWRFAKWGKITVTENGSNLLVEPRLAQIMLPLMRIIEDQEVKDEFVKFMTKRNQQIVEERGETLEGKVAQAICQLWMAGEVGEIRVKEVLDAVIQLLDNPDYKLTSRKIGSILRNTFNLAMLRRDKGYIVERSSANETKLEKIAQKFGIPWEGA